MRLSSKLTCFGLFPLIVVGGLLAIAAADETVTVSVDEETDVLVVKGTEQAVRNATRLMTARDVAPQMVSIQVEISISDPEGGRDSQKIVDSLQLTTIEGQKALMQFGQQVAVVTGRQSFGGRGTQTQTEQRMTGSMLQVVPRITDTGVVVQLTLEKSWMEHPAPPASEDEASGELQTPTTYTTEIQTTLMIASGKTQTLKAVVSGGSGVREAEIKVSATTGSSTDGRAVAERDNRERTDRPAPPSARSRSGQTRGGFSRQGSPPSATQGRGGFQRGSGNRTTMEDAEATAERMLNQFDKNNDGELKGDERKRLDRFLQIIGFDSSEKVTAETMAEKLRNRIKERDSSADRQRPEEDDREDSDSDGSN